MKNRNEKKKNPPGRDVNIAAICSYIFFVFGFFCRIGAHYLATIKRGEEEDNHAVLAELLGERGPRSPGEQDT